MSQTPTPRILVVEDDASMRNLVAEELQEAGYQVMAAATMGDARDRLAESAPDLVVSDLRLPDGSGIDLLEHVRRQRAGRTLGFVLITGFGTIEQAVSALKKDADDFLTKPLDFDHLRLSVGRSAREHPTAARTSWLRGPAWTRRFSGHGRQQPAHAAALRSHRARRRDRGAGADSR